jgi:hypothetical protein
MDKKRRPIGWFDLCEEHDYPAAQSYLTLLFPAAQARAYVKRLRTAPVSKFKAKDIFRASGLSLLGVSNSHILRTGRRFSPESRSRRSCWFAGPGAPGSSWPTAITACAPSTSSMKTR